MDPDHLEPTGDDDEGPRAEPSLVPFLAALAVVGIGAVLAFLFLRSDDQGVLVRPDRLDAVGEDVVRAVVFDLPACERITRAQADFDDDRILLELVAVEAEGCDEEGGREVVAEIDLGRPVDGRQLVPGVGRTRFPCTGDGGGVRCAPER